MEGLLGGLKGVFVYLDNVLVTGITNEQHLKTLEEVLWSFEEAGVRLNKGKCSFLAPSVEYSGSSD